MFHKTLSSCKFQICGWYGYWVSLLQLHPEKKKTKKKKKNIEEEEEEEEEEEDEEDKENLFCVYYTHTTSNYIKLHQNFDRG